MDRAVILSTDLYEISTVDVLVLWCLLWRTCYIWKNGAECSIFFWWSDRCITEKRSKARHCSCLRSERYPQQMSGTSSVWTSVLEVAEWSLVLVLLCAQWWGCCMLKLCSCCWNECWEAWCSITSLSLPSVTDPSHRIKFWLLRQSSRSLWATASAMRGLLVTDYISLAVWVLYGWGSRPLFLKYSAAFRRPLSRLMDRMKRTSPPALLLLTPVLLSEEHRL